MRRTSSTLKSQFFVQILTVLLIVAVVSGSIQIWIMYLKIREDIDSQASMISNSIRQEIKVTEMASAAIERQLDLKLEAYSKQIADKLRGRSIDQITNEELAKISKEVGVTGITLFVRTDEDVVGARSTESNEIGFGLKKLNPYAYQMLDLFMTGKKLPEDLSQILSFMNPTTLITFITQSGSHTDEPKFFKYAYYTEPGFDFLIDPYIEANEIYKFTQDVGPESWIQEVLKHNDNTVEIAVLDPKVFQDPSLAEKIYPPMKKVVNGQYKLEDQKDTDLLVKMMKDKQKTSYTAKYGGKKILKIFMPFQGDKVLYIALNYNNLAWPLYKHAIVIIAQGFIALLALFILTTRFFNRIYQHIQQITKQIKQLESGDLTAKSEVRDKGELGSLSESANKMAETLHQVLMETHGKATQAQKLSVLLEKEADYSVERAFALSMETTSKSRDSVEEIYDFLSLVEGLLEDHKADPQTAEIRSRIETMRELARDRTNGTTEITITLHDLLKSLHSQSSELSDLSSSLLGQLAKFKL